VSDLLDITETATGVRVTWLDDDIDAVAQTAEVTYEYERPEPDVGICGGYVADGDAPDWILEAVAAWAEAQASDAADDASERRAESRAEAL
jgi:hypothetical protein